MDDTTGQIDDFADETENDGLAQADLENDTLGDMQPNALEDSHLAEEISPDNAKAKIQPRRGRPRKHDAPNPPQPAETEDHEELINSQLDDSLGPGQPDETDVPTIEQDEQDEEVEQEEQETEEHAEAEASKDEREQAAIATKGTKRGRPRKPLKEERDSKRPRTQTAKAQAKQTNTNSVLARKGDRRSNEEFKKPGPPRSNVRERHETPAGGDDEALYTRSGRMSYRPLASWKGERIDFKPMETADGAFVQSIHEIVRMEDVTPQKKRVINRAGDAPRRRRRRRAATIFEEHDADAEDDIEDWEAGKGVISGSVRVWDPEVEAGLEDERRDQELAFAAAKIEARDNVEGSFQFAKTLTMPFFGSGIVELQPGGVKRQKNSRRMQMMFFVHFGKVTVDVCGTTFKISKGGVWQVPRGEFIQILGSFSVMLVLLSYRLWVHACIRP